MNKAYFFRNPSSLSDLKKIMNNGEAREYIIEKIVELDEKEYNEFIHHLLLTHDMIVNNVNLMFFDENKVLHCILVTISGGIEGILIKSEGHVLFAAYWNYILK